MVVGKRSSAVLLFTACALVISSCSKDPSSVGSDPSGVTFDSLVVSAETSATYRVPISSPGPTLLVGRYQNIEARILLQFGSVALPESVIVGASIRLVPSYWFKDSTGTLAFTIHRIVRAWDELALTFDSTQTLFESTPVGSYTSRPEVVPRRLKPVSPRDTVLAEVDSSLVRGWVRTGENYGVLLIPSAPCDVVFGFTSVFDFFTDIRPELVVRYIVRDSTQRLDSLFVRTSQDAFVAFSSDTGWSSQLFYAQAGIADRGLIRFGLAAVPRSANVVIANLTLFRNNASSLRNEFSLDSLAVQMVVSTAPISGGISVTAVPIGPDSSSVFTADARTIVQRWATGQANHGLAIRAFGEFSTLDRFAFYGATDSLFKPTLRIVYSVLQ